ncbi:hypothetical protein MRX96_043926 [Rhipicephalus microplus]
METESDEGDSYEDDRRGHVISKPIGKREKELLSDSVLRSRGTSSSRCVTQFQTLGPKPLLRAPVPFRFMRLPGLLPHRRSNPRLSSLGTTKCKSTSRLCPGNVSLRIPVSPLGSQTLRRSARARKPPDWYRS